MLVMLLWNPGSFLSHFVILCLLKKIYMLLFAIVLPCFCWWIVSIASKLPELVLLDDHNRGIKCECHCNNGQSSSCLWASYVAPKSFHTGNHLLIAWLLLHGLCLLTNFNSFKIYIVGHHTLLSLPSIYLVMALSNWSLPLYFSFCTVTSWDASDLHCLFGCKHLKNILLCGGKGGKLCMMELDSGGRIQ